MHNFKNLVIWQKSMELVSEVFAITSQFPNEHKFGLAMQMQRSAISIPSNISEGSGRESDKELVRFLNIANGSCNELETQILIARNLDLIAPNQTEEICSHIHEIQKMNYTLRRKFEK
ncbi:MAG TPA: four helix bundle protein [Cryomorphaceae bacterium]|nr:four helix bundle protein [Owenweeksia sp.]MBG00127.1 four helix bundle protein [Owenweeksia sp.]HAD98378.1 four helix bundle protein [Cryomorphaceae bacterium]HCQ17050.1 four helix bundle protein [Cryomorphaceae bacterium]|tara:strand:+ start:275 stop:628 length:354 start_codon:yes stop_codon:yes gene_type:complete